MCLLASWDHIEGVTYNFINEKKFKRHDIMRPLREMMVDAEKWENFVGF